MSKVTKTMPIEAKEKESLRKIFGQLEMLLYYKDDILVDLSQALISYYTSKLGEEEGTEGIEAIKRKNFSFYTITSLLDELSLVGKEYDFRGLLNRL